MFDSYPLARAIARFPLPVFCGLGHLKDVSIADLLAHSSEKTPTRIAEIIIAHNRQFEQQVLDIRNGLVIKSQHLIAGQNERINSFSNNIMQGSSSLVSATHQKLFNAVSFISSGCTSVLNNQKSTLTSMAGKLSTKPVIRIAMALNELGNLEKTVSDESFKFIRFQKGLLQHHISIFRLLSPENTLARGFAIVKKDGKILTSASNVKKGDTIDILLSGDLISTKVIDKKKQNGNKNDL
jgi:exodeoxyribonuclease VII large subunit